MIVTLIFPPVTDPRSPHLALPSLAAVLREAGINTDLIDLDIEGMLKLLEPNNLARASERLSKKYGSKSSNTPKPLRRLLSFSHLLPDRITNALATFHTPEQFYNPNQFNAARETLLDCLDLISLSASRPISYSISPICYDVEGIDVQSMTDLVKVTSDVDSNLFVDFWEKDVFPSIDSRRPDLIGITIANRQQIIPGLTLARSLRERGHFVVVGGTVYTKFSMQLLKLPAFFEYFADGVVVYEGETAILELTRQLTGDRNFSEVPNFLYLSKEKVCLGDIYLENVDALPTPDFSGLALNKYLTPEPVLPILFGKGCYFNRCKFCDIPYINHISKKSYRIRSPEHVADDIVDLYHRFNCRHFEFTDEALAPGLLEKLAKALEPHRDKAFRFVGYARLEPYFTPKFCQILARMGMKKIFFGLESGAQETLDHMDKGIQISDVPAVLENCRNAGINFHIFSIIGFPQESEESAKKTYLFFEKNSHIINHPGNSFDIHPFGLELRTAYFEEAKEMGINIPHEALDKEFVIGIGNSWANKQGLTHMEVEMLIDEFNSHLKQVYNKYRSVSGHLWPAFEEFAILYASQYEGHEFPYRMSLPDETDTKRYRLSWNPATFLEWRKENKLSVSSRFGKVELDSTTYKKLSSKKFRLLSELLEELCADHSSSNKLQSKDIVDKLLERHLLYLEPYLKKTDNIHLKMKSMMRVI